LRIGQKEGSEAVKKAAAVTHLSQLNPLLLGPIQPPPCLFGLSLGLLQSIPEV